MGTQSLATRISQPPIKARQLIQAHRETYKTYWSWVDDTLNYSQLKGELHTVFGWRVYVGDDTNNRMLMNFPVQANGAEMLRVACILATEAGIMVCAPIHDAILIEAPLNEIDETVLRTQQIMEDASSTVLRGFKLRSDAVVIKYSDRFYDERGAKMWEKVQQVLSGVEKVTQCG